MKEDETIVELFSHHDVKVMISTALKDYIMKTEQRVDGILALGTDPEHWTVKGWEQERMLAIRVNRAVNREIDRSGGGKTFAITAPESRSDHPERFDLPPQHSEEVKKKKKGAA